MRVADRPDTPPSTVVELTADLVSPAATLLAQYRWPLRCPTDHLASCEASLHRLLDWPSAQFFLAAQSEEWVGFVSINWGFSTSKGQPIVRIQDLFVLPRYRHRGIARSLLQHGMQLGRQHGANRLQLETGTQNMPARALYTAYGFEWLADKEIYMLFL